jgi:hypothetical protein
MLGGWGSQRTLMMVRFGLKQKGMHLTVIS